MISGIPVTGTLLEQLKKKLNVGNLRSIQLNCVPGRTKSKLDLADTKVIDETIPNEFLDKLFNHKTKFSYSLSFDNLNLNLGSEDEEKQKALGVLSKRLNHLNAYNKEDYQEFGYESFGFGFPLVVFRPQNSPDKLIRAPLFIWHMSIEKDLSKTNTWKLSRNVDQEIEFNNLLRSYIGQQDDLTVEGFADEELKDGVLDFNEVISNTVKFIRHFHSVSADELESSLRQSFNDGIKAIPSTKTLKETANTIPKVYWGGVFGRYHLRNEAIRQEMREDMFELLSEYSEDEEASETNINTLLHSETAALTDPSQLGILNYLKENRHLIIQGPPGTGKSESITGIIINALEHGNTCMVVCEKKTAMDVLKQNLIDIDPEIGKLAAVLEDVSTDRRELVDSVRDRYDQYGNKVFNRPESSRLAERLELIEDKIRDIHRRKKFLNEKKIYDGSKYKGWTSAVGQELKAKHKNGSSPIKDSLREENFDLAKIDYKEVTNFLNQFEEISRNLNFQNTLHFIPQKKLVDLDPMSLQDELNELLFLDEPNTLKQFVENFEIELEEKENLVNKKVDELIEQINSQLKRLLHIYSEVKQQNLFKKDNWWFKVIKPVSGISKNLKQKVDLFLEVPSLNGKIKEDFDKLRVPISFSNELSIEFLEKDIERIKSAISELNKKSKSKDLFNGLIKSPFCGISINEDLKEDFINWRNNTREFLMQYYTNSGDMKFSGFSDSIERLKFVSSCDRDFKVAKEHGFIDHFQWQKKFRSEPEILQSIVTQLMDNELDDWVSHFDEYYIGEKLREKLSVELTSSYEVVLKALKNERTQLIEELKSRIPKYWKFRQSEVNRDINIPVLYNKRGSKGRRRNSLRKIASKSFESLISYFPVMMVSPSVCASMFPLKPDLFDYVIFDEASQLKIEESLSTLIRGKRKVVSGDKNQMPPSYWFTSVNTDELEVEDGEEFDPYASWDEQLLSAGGAADLAESESLLEFAELCGFEPYHLDFHYRSHHPLLIEFSNAAFYKSRLNPLPERINQTPIQFIPVNGTNENQQNRDEANVAVDILKKIKRNENGKLPTVGIATFNRKQKNLFWEILKREIQLDEEFNKKYREFEENGLFVKNLENIQGDERDIIILSTTYGKDSDGNFSRLYGPINRPGLGRRLLNVIVTRAKKKIYVLNSVPSDIYLNYRQELGVGQEKERGYFHAYLAYAKAVSEKDIESVDSILKFLRERTRTIDNGDGLTESPFEEAVYQALQKEIDNERITLQYKTGGFRIDIAIKSKITGREFLAIECDGAAYHSSAEDYAWDSYRQETLEKHGFVFHRIWSRDWWENDARELKKLVSFIHKQDHIDKSHQPFDDPVAEDLDLTPLLENTGIVVEIEEKKKEIEEDVKENKDKDKKKEKTQSEKVFKPQAAATQLEYNFSSKPKVELGQIVTLKYLDDGKEVKVKLAKGRSNIKEKKGIMVLDEKSPVGEAILDRREGDTVEIGNLEKYCKIVSIN